ncbi:hypothetical protein TAO_0608 [Candidatus Nitrosoglobus terrae]|uniref:Uncharacterized protein n=1 Tax=Candidatus Nitrosoglobus terrae TaxID=1630141 RepID=A0A1Q2SLH3_9GAMM|nr:hypothetical protein [Candidatus Nitrosoglobus terrae]BAW79978.1 hypothetical protein TAO_0608 [Candidatus Nitrosoglobus terrae]
MINHKFTKEIRQTAISATLTALGWILITTTVNSAELNEQLAVIHPQGEIPNPVIGIVLPKRIKVETLAPSVLKPFVPKNLAGIPRTDFLAERNNSLGTQISTAQGVYCTDNIPMGGLTLSVLANKGSFCYGNGPELILEIIDTGDAKGPLAITWLASLGQERLTENSYEKTYRQGNRLIHEEWDNLDKYGEYSVMLGNRFMVKITSVGIGNDINHIKQAMTSINLMGIERLKDQGVSKD